MKCTDCQGTGLENENKLCQTCNGLGKVGEEEPESREIIIQPEVVAVEKEVDKPKKVAKKIKK